MRDWFAAPRYWTWTRRTVIAAVVLFCAMYVQSCRKNWNEAERLDLWIYLESGVWKTLSENSLTSYRMLDGVTAKKQKVPVVGDEIEAVTGQDDEPMYRITAEGSRAGYVRLEWRTSVYNDRRLHGFLHQWVFHDDMYAWARRPFFCALVLLGLLLPVAIPKDRWPEFSYVKQWQKLMNFIERRRRAAAPVKAAAPPVPAPIPPPVVAAKQPEARPAAVKKPRPRFE